MGTLECHDKCPRKWYYCFCWVVKQSWCYKIAVPYNPEKLQFRNAELQVSNAELQVSNVELQFCNSVGVLQLMSSKMPRKIVNNIFAENVAYKIA